MWNLLCGEYLAKKNSGMSLLVVGAKLRSIRPLQRDVIEAAIAGHDIFLQAATSFGKSLCFQLPAVVSQGGTSAFGSFT
jgi:superfamily II DNA helicase RecQ